MRIIEMYYQVVTEDNRTYEIYYDRGGKREILVYYAGNKSPIKHPAKFHSGVP